MSVPGLAFPQLPPPQEMDGRWTNPTSIGGSAPPFPMGTFNAQTGQFTPADPAFGKVHSNELSRITLDIDIWPSSEYDKKLNPGELLFVRRNLTSRSNGISAVASVPQIAEMCRQTHDYLEDLYARYMKKPDSVIIEKELAELYVKYKLYGECALSSSDVFEKIKTDTKLRKLIYVSSEHLKEEWKHLGMIISISENTNMFPFGGTKHGEKSVVVGVNGPAMAQEVINLWGNDLKVGEHVFLILTRKLIPEQSTNVKPVYGPFVWDTWHSYDLNIPEEKFSYYDDAGVYQKAIICYVGKVHMDVLSKDQQPDHFIEKCLGNYNSSGEASNIGKLAKTVSINLRKPRIYNGLFDW